MSNSFMPSGKLTAILLLLVIAVAAVSALGIVGADYLTGRIFQAVISNALTRKPMPNIYLLLGLVIALPLGVIALTGQITSKLIVEMLAYGLAGTIALPFVWFRLRKLRSK